MRRLLASLLLLALLAVPSSARRQKQPELPEATKNAWVKAGATVGWMGHANFEAASFRTWYVNGDVPAFSFLFRASQALGALPAVNQPFGLRLHGGSSNDDLKEAAALANLVGLYASYGNADNEGLKH